MQKLEEESEQQHTTVWISIRRPLLSLACCCRNRPLLLLACCLPRPLLARCSTSPMNATAACPLLARSVAAFCAHAAQERGAARRRAGEGSRTPLPREEDRGAAAAARCRARIEDEVKFFPSLSRQTTRRTHFHSFTSIPLSR